MSDQDPGPDLLQRKLAREQAARKQAEQLLEEKSRELYERNQLLQQEILEHRRTEEQLKAQTRKLEQLNRELERSNGELEQFAYVASHDLQAPLRNIASFTQLLGRECKGKVSTNADEFFGFIEQAARHMKTLIDDLLRLSRISTRGERALVATQAVVDQARALLRTSLAETRAEVSYADLPEVMGDRGQLIQLFQNLIGNAIKFQAPGAMPLVRISATQEGDHWHFVVQDNGIGIASHQLEAIFAIFRRLHTDEQYAGTGIGLSICKKIAERHGGRIWAESEPGQGAAFHFTLARFPPVAGRGPDRS